MQLVRPAPEHLASYAEALRRGWSPDTRRPEAAGDALADLATSPERFLEAQDDREGRGPPVILPDGTAARRLPGYKRWLWDGAFCGEIGVRWDPGTTALPPTCLGHVGYSVVAWRRGRGYATRALALLVPDLAAATGLPWVELTTDAANVASQRVIEANGGVLVGRFTLPPAHGGGEGRRYRIALA